MSDVTPETKQVVEMLTGISYENCFGNNNIGYKCTDSDANVKVVS
jgi:oligogalacturonide transporter